MILKWINKVTIMRFYLSSLKNVEYQIPLFVLFILQAFVDFFYFAILHSRQFNQFCKLDTIHQNESNNLTPGECIGDAIFKIKLTYAWSEISGLTNQSNISNVTNLSYQSNLYLLTVKT